MAPEPPEDLCDAGKTLWRNIAATKPADVWNPGALDLLRTFCVMSTERDRIIRDVLRVERPGTKEYWEGFSALNASAKTQISAAHALRLSIQALVARQSGKITEKGVGASKGPAKRKLLGGNAVWQGRNEAKLN